ncbi:MAG: hypothetical protein FWE31_02045 [Firmicutes bacterium]|nr:hypothetical protein [Bacillota bacterium]
MKILIIILLWLLLIPILVMCLPFLVLGYIYYLIVSPFEKRKFRKSGYAQVCPKYHFGVTKTIGFILFKLLKSTGTEFRHMTYLLEEWHEEIRYILNLNGREVSIWCTEECMYYDADRQNWFFCDDQGYPFKNVSSPFEIIGGELLICLPDGYLKFECLSEQDRGLLQQDKRFICQSDVIQLLSTQSR